MVLPEAVSAAMSPFRIVYDIAAPGFYHAAEHIWIFSSAYSLGREHLGVVASYMLDYLQRLACVPVDEAVFRFFGYEIPILIYEVACVGDIFRLLEFSAACLPQELPDLCFKLRKFVPGLEDLYVVPEGSDAGGNIILIAGFSHEGELPGHTLRQISRNIFSDPGKKFCLMQLLT